MLSCTPSVSLQAQDCGEKEGKSGVGRHDEVPTELLQLLNRGHGNRAGDGGGGGVRGAE